jgi:hypothetical protein
VAELSKACYVLHRVTTGIVGSNLFRGMDICVASVFMLSTKVHKEDPKTGLGRICLSNYTRRIY